MLGEERTWAYLLTTAIGQLPLEGQGIIILHCFTLIQEDTTVITKGDVYSIYYGPGFVLVKSVASRLSSVQYSVCICLSTSLLIKKHQQKYTHTQNRKKLKKQHERLSKSDQISTCQAAACQKSAVLAFDCWFFKFQQAGANKSNCKIFDFLLNNCQGCLELPVKMHPCYRG